MCCDLCPEFEECEHPLDESEYGCLKCPEYHDCDVRSDTEYVGFDEEEGTENLEF